MVGLPPNDICLPAMWAGIQPVIYCRWRERLHDSTAVRAVNIGAYACSGITASEPVVSRHDFLQIQAVLAPDVLLLGGGEHRHFLSAVRIGIHQRVILDSLHRLTLPVRPARRSGCGKSRAPPHRCRTGRWRSHTVPARCPVFGSARPPRERRSESGTASGSRNRPG